MATIRGYITKYVTAGSGAIVKKELRESPATPGRLYDQRSNGYTIGKEVFLTEAQAQAHARTVIKKKIESHRKLLKGLQKKLEAPLPVKDVRDEG